MNPDIGARATARRDELARIFHDRIVADARAAQIVAESLDVTLQVVLRVMVPHLTSRGLSARQIAWRLDVTPRTVSRYRTRSDA